MTMKLVQQYLYERATWHRLLDYLEEENILYKNRIAEILKHDIDHSLIENIELFLNKFILEDSIISLFRHDITDLGNKITINDINDKQKENYDNITIIMTQNKLRRGVETIEPQFNKLKFEFNKYLSEHFTTFK